MRERFDAFLRGTPSAPALMPLVETLAPRVAGTTAEALAADATLRGNASLRAARLLEAEAVLLGFDIGIAAAACRESPAAPAGTAGFAQLAAALDRLVQTERTHTGIVAALCGPATLAAALAGNPNPEALAAAKQYSTALAEALCRQRPDLLVLRENAALFAGGLGTAQRKAYGTLKNVVDYFDVPLALWIEGWEAATVADACRLKLPILLLGPDADGNAAAPELASRLAAELDGIGLALPFAELARACSLASAYRAALGERACLFTSLQDLPADSDLEALRALATRLAG